MSNHVVADERVVGGPLHVAITILWDNKLQLLLLCTWPLQYFETINYSYYSFARGRHRVISRRGESTRGSTWPPKITKMTTSVNICRMFLFKLPPKYPWKDHVLKEYKVLGTDFLYIANEHISWYVNLQHFPGSHNHAWSISPSENWPTGIATRCVTKRFHPQLL